MLHCGGFFPSESLRAKWPAGQSSYKPSSTPSNIEKEEAIQMQIACPNTHVLPSASTVRVLMLGKQKTNWPSGRDAGRCYLLTPLSGSNTRKQTLI
ncbi:hypothetical protein AAFF_G00307850 [Aldrovandia affinis]|uniref:Uncharacterized protein n=1 Tax=Aldrovandia affinis TaxID=143900 RepID=A0AAD7W037_9TELE|nr:hypothetical protein AAFF_G00307850 [Aldrovandia affinis]